MNLIQYQTECQSTKSNEFFGDRVTKLFFKNAILEAVEALTRLDAIKKSMFYGKASTRYPVNGGFEGEEDGKGNAVETCASVNVILEDSEQGELAGNKGVDVIHGILGKATEASELLEALYTAAYNGQPLDRVNLIEEVGDGFWYDGITLEAVGSNFHDAAARNNAKLKKRFPNKFTTENAVTRDLTGEREMLEIPAFLRKEDEPIAESDVEMLKRLGTDGKLWAHELENRLQRFDAILSTDRVDYLHAWFANAIEAGAMRETSKLAKKLSDLDNCVAIQSGPGTGDTDHYMRGMANGLILAQSIMKGTECKYLDANCVKDANKVASTDTPLEVGDEAESERIREENAG
jgi:hypothetical protein